MRPVGSPPWGSAANHPLPAATRAAFRGIFVKSCEQNFLEAGVVLELWRWGWVGGWASPLGPGQGLVSSVLIVVLMSRSSWSRSSGARQLCQAARCSGEPQQIAPDASRAYTWRWGRRAGPLVASWSTIFFQKLFVPLRSAQRKAIGLARGRTM